MNIQPQSTQPISDDQELAKVLAGVSSDKDQAEAVVPEIPALPPVPAAEPSADPNTPADAVAPEAEPAPAPEVVLDPLPEPVLAHAPEPALDTSAPVAAPSGELDGVKQEAINELRPLVDKLTLPAEEKFDTYLLLIRSTDDKSLIAPAHAAARDIQDEARRAQALLDIIKEIDFLSQNN